MNSSKENRLAVLFERIGPYHFARLRAVGRLVSTVAIEVSAEDDIYAWDLVAGADGFKRVTLFATDARKKKSADEIELRVNRALDECRPTAVAIPGWSDRAALSALKWCARRRIPTVMMSESTEWDQKRSVLREWIKRRLVRCNSTSLVGGTPHAEYIQKLGLAEDRVFLGYDVVDNDHFIEGADNARKQGAELRIKHGLPQKYFLASARFVEKKNLVRLLRAYAQYRDKIEQTGAGLPRLDTWKLVLLGSGPLQETLNLELSALKIEGQVLMPGFKQYGELPVYYGLAGAFVHASTTEQWGLVVNEAMACGLPVIVSDRCGCARDLVEAGVNGFTFDPSSVEQLAELMRRVSAPEFRLSEFGQASSRIIDDWGPERFGSGLKAAVLKATEAKNAPVHFLNEFVLSVILRHKVEQPYA
jgi:1,2-diacylglycerol 3-alpha-glucosyltransferase